VEVYVVECKVCKKDLVFGDKPTREKVEAHCPYCGVINEFEPAKTPGKKQPKEGDK
jgi:phage FluMu protein Com